MRDAKIVVRSTCIQFFKLNNLVFTGLKILVSSVEGVEELIYCPNLRRLELDIWILRTFTLCMKAERWLLLVKIYAQSKATLTYTD